MNICIYGASSNEISQCYTKEAFDLGCILASHGHNLVFGGGDGGLMGAVARGVFSKNGKITGIAPAFFSVDGILYPGCTEMILTDTMRSRKQKMEEISDAFAVLPGGIGTLEEFFEIFTLKQLGRHNKPIAVLNKDGYYDEMISMLCKIVSEKFMHRKCMNLFRVFGNASDVIDYLESYIPENLNFYK